MIHNRDLIKTFLIGNTTIEYILWINRYCIICGSTEISISCYVTRSLVYVKWQQHTNKHQLLIVNPEIPIHLNRTKHSVIVRSSGFHLLTSLKYLNLRYLSILIKVCNLRNFVIVIPVKYKLFFTCKKIK